MSEKHLSRKIKLIFVLIGVLLLVGIAAIVWAYQTGRLGTKADTAEVLPAGATAKGKVKLNNMSRLMAMQDVTVSIDYNLTQLLNRDKELPEIYGQISTTPNGRGDFSIGPLPMGWKVVLSATNGINTDRQVVETPGTVTTFNLAKELTIDDSRSVGQIHFKMRDKSGNPISGATVTLTSLNSQTQADLTKQLNSQGVTDFSKVPPGQYVMFVDKKNDDESITSYNFGLDDTILVHPAENVNKNLQEAE